MFYIIAYPIIDLRSFIQGDTYLLNREDLQLSCIYDNSFLRSIGEVSHNDKLSGSIFDKRNAYFNARNAIKVNDISPYRNTSFLGNFFVPKIVSRRLYTENNIFRYEIGMSNYIAFRKKLTSHAIGNITEWILAKSISIPTEYRRKNTSIYGAGKYLANLMLYSTTQRPSQNYKNVSRKWMQSGNPMVIIECNNNDLCYDNNDYDLAGFEKYFSDELHERGIILYHNLFNNTIHVWIISYDVNTPSSDVVNLSIMLRKIHQNREGLKRVLRSIDGNMINFDDKDIVKRLGNCLANLTKPIISKSYYGYSCLPILSLIRQYDEIVNKTEEEYIRNKLLQIPNFSHLFSRIHTAISNENYDLFISHASEDNVFTQLLVDELEKLKINIWYDKYKLECGENQVREIENGLRRSNAAIVIISKNYLSKKWTNAELDTLIRFKINDGIEIYPIILDVTYEQLNEQRPLLASITGEKVGPKKLEDIAMIIKGKIDANKLN